VPVCAGFGLPIFHNMQVFSIDTTVRPSHFSHMARILVVEDHADSREATSLCLQRAGFEVDTATNGREALALVIDKTPDLVLLDLMIPEMDGVKLLQAIRSYYRLAGIPVIGLTALNSGRLLEEAKSLNIELLFKTATTMEQVIAAINRTLNQPPSATRVRPVEKWRGDSISPL
jgi:CheY-like chemotaxis protein